MINTKTAVIQNYGENLKCYVRGKDSEDAYGQWLSAANWAACNLSEPDWITKTVIAFWTTKEKLVKYFNDVLESDTGEKLYESIQKEQFRSVNSNNEYAEFGIVKSEAPDLDFKDACILHAFERDKVEDMKSKVVFYDLYD